MSAFDLPPALRAARMEWGTQKAGLQFQGPFNGTVQTLDLVAERFMVNLTFPPRLIADAGSIEGFLFRLTGGLHQVRLWHLTRPIPVGTMRGSPVLHTTVTRGASSLVLETTPGWTLEAGDLFKISAQLFMSAERCVANGSGLITVPLVHRVRKTLVNGLGVTWNRPTALFIMPAQAARSAYSPGILAESQIDLQEVWDA